MTHSTSYDTASIAEGQVVSMVKNPPVFANGETDRFLDLLRQGYSTVEACWALGISYEHFRHWMMRGNDPLSKSPKNCLPEIIVEPYWSFARAVRLADAEGRTTRLLKSDPGRPPLSLDTVQRDKLCREIARGASYHEACHLAHVPLSTFLSWLRHGGYPRQLTSSRVLNPVHIREPYISFVTAVLAAEEESFGT